MFGEPCTCSAPHFLFVSPARKYPRSNAARGGEEHLNKRTMPSWTPPPPRAVTPVTPPPTHMFDAPLLHPPENIHTYRPIRNQIHADLSHILLPPKHTSSNTPNKLLIQQRLSIPPPLRRLLSLSRQRADTAPPNGARTTIPPSRASGPQHTHKTSTTTITNTTKARTTSYPAAG